ncbi:hypothetical protein OVY01_07380 [Robbsia sp. Bb-Pol-6]|uniref:Uncharacterized protein n=1 Tax=Robbsia betulipollinis TaxID=2981849 RepID=A0ABT3ZKS6_9BURK|nr:hypothetical protein [Robbsia betulipollinis]MCY0387057.1 hypothetical protein [Robbsia betulipollinis]
MKAGGAAFGMTSVANMVANDAVQNDAVHVAKHGHSAAHSAGAKRSAARAARARHQRNGDVSQGDAAESEPAPTELDELQELVEHHPKMGHKAQHSRRRRRAQSSGPDVDDDQDDDSESIALLLDEENRQSLERLILSVAEQEGESADSQGDERGRGAPLDRLTALDGGRGEPMHQKGATPRHAPAGATTAHDSATGPGKRAGFQRAAPPATIADATSLAEASLLGLMGANRHPSGSRGAPSAAAGGMAARPTMPFRPGASGLPEHAAMRIMRLHLTACRESGKHSTNTGASTTNPPSATLDRVRDRLIAAAAAQGIEPVPCAQLALEQQRFNLLLPLWLLQLRAPRQSAHHGSAIARLCSLGAR